MRVGFFFVGRCAFELLLELLFSSDTQQIRALLSSFFNTNVFMSKPLGISNPIHSILLILFRPAVEREKKQRNRRRETNYMPLMMTKMRRKFASTIGVYVR